MIIAYWSITILLFVAQLVYTLNSNTQIRYEELADSVRNVFWLSGHQVYDGVSNGVGWYSTLLIVYNLFGFDLFTAKFVRLAISLISLFSLSYLLFKYVRLPSALLPLLVIGLSPTMLFLNSTQTEYGLDLQMLPIYLLILSSINFKGKRWLTLVKILLLWTLIMVGAMAYPTFVYFVPVIFILFLWKMKDTLHLGWLIFSLLSFLLPLMALFFYLDSHSRSLLIYDETRGSGLFRGAGSLQINGENLAKNLGGIFTDLFVTGSSYHFEINQAEFSLIFPIFILTFMVYAIFKTYTAVYEMKRLTLLVLVSMMAVLVLSSITLDPSGSPGIRRYTPILAAFYTLFILVWKQLINVKSQMSNFKYFGIAVMSLLLLHHIIVYPINLIHLKDPSPDAYPIWFDPAPYGAGFDNLVETVQKEDLKLACVDEKGTPFYCRLSEVYAAVVGACKWNRLDCNQILGYDFKTNQFIPLTTELWDSYYFEH